MTKDLEPQSVDKIIDDYVKAIGGRTAIEKITSRVMKGSLVTAAGSAQIEVFEKAPDKFLIVIDSPVAGLSKNGYNGAVAWAQNQQRGLREMSGPEVENFKREYDLRREIKLNQMYPQKRLKGKETIAGREAYALEATATDNSVETMYFDVTTALLIRRDVTIQGTTVQAYFEDYRDVGGIKLPFTIRRSRADFTFTYKFNDIQHNVAIDDEKFDKPR